MNPQPSPKYTPSVGQKFNPDGSAKAFPGNTVICHVPQDSATFELLLRVRRDAEAQPWGRKYSFLPPSSYHMTVFDGVCDQVRKPENWTSKLPLDASLEQVDDVLRTAWPNVPKPAGFSMQYRSFYAHDYIGMFIQPTTLEVERELRGFRDQLSAAFGIRHPNHAEYTFHITLAYGIEVLTETEDALVTEFEAQMHRDLQNNFGVLRLNTPELTFFADMACFAPVRPKFS
ncbi:MAG: DUF1868 domain-containing protein [Anaerolineales bacterium]|nr:DUF1868 domain-containing protein [Anaerolineales bacterium]